MNPIIFPLVAKSEFMVIHPNTARFDFQSLDSTETPISLVFISLLHFLNDITGGEIIETSIMFFVAMGC